MIFVRYPDPPSLRAARLICSDYAPHLIPAQRNFVDDEVICGPLTAVERAT